MEEEGTTNTVLCHAQSQKSALAPRSGSDQTVWIDGWQMQCCGDLFRVGSNVSWNLRPADRDWLTSVLGEETSASVDWAEEHHSDSTSPATEAKVVTITAVHCRYAPDPRRPQGLVSRRGLGGTVITGVRRRVDAGSG
ncbi:DUF6578 domain-containing protein [Nonomuraea sp. NPDC050556]|uniref:DUF6578 domain-containing protein n=1 Tax=Nonomuraea sp. NPDC050556 TaxID=3364369 RepID=UPI0037B90FB4